MRQASGLLRLSRKAGQVTGFAGEDARSTILQVRH
jgi:hypothetical protein